MRKVVWFAAGAAAGAGSTVYLGKKVKQAAREAAEKMKPVNVARSAVSGVGRTGRSVVDAMKEGRAAAAAKEVELKAARDAKLKGTAEPEPLALGSGQVQIVVVDARDAGLLDGLDQLRQSRTGPRRSSRRHIAASDAASSDAASSQGRGGRGGR